MDSSHGMFSPSINVFLSQIFCHIEITYQCLHPIKPFVDPGHPLHDLFPPRVWAIRIPVILILFGSAIVGSFLSMVMIKSNRKRVAKGKAAAVGKKKA